MWIFLNDAFLSIVDKSKGLHDKLTVRARFKGDIETVFGDKVKVFKLPKSDYAYRALIDRKIVAEKIAESIMNIRYSNFKDSVIEDWRHDVYLDVWGELYKEQLYQERKQNNKSMTDWWINEYYQKLSEGNQGPTSLIKKSEYEAFKNSGKEK